MIDPPLERKTSAERARPAEDHRCLYCQGEGKYSCANPACLIVLMQGLRHNGLELIAKHVVMAVAVAQREGLPTPQIRIEGSLFAGPAIIGSGANVVDNSHGNVGNGSHGNLVQSGGNNTATSGQNSPATAVASGANNNYGDCVENKQDIKAQAIGAIAQGNKSVATNSGPMFVGSASEADTITQERWKKDMEAIAWALADKHDELARKPNTLFNGLASVAPLNTTLTQFQEDALVAAKAVIPEGERPEASYRMKVVAEGMIAGTTHAVVHKFIEWFGPQLIPVVVAAADTVHRHF